MEYVEEDVLVTAFGRWSRSIVISAEGNSSEPAGSFNLSDIVGVVCESGEITCDGDMPPADQPDDPDIDQQWAMHRLGLFRSVNCFYAAL